MHRIRFVAVALVVLLAWVTTDSGIFWSQLVGYGQVCPSALREGGPCDGDWADSPRTTFTVNADKQSVIAQAEDEAPVALEKCVVVDRRNWRYSEPKSDAVFVASGGRISLTQDHNGILVPHEIVSRFIRFVPRWRWMLALSAAKPSA